MTASRASESASALSDLKHGIFTYYLLQGLSGKADRNGDGVVTVAELYDYVAPEVDRRARAPENVSQRPQMRGAIPGDVPLVRVAR